jgi:methionyl aminopeptidase
MICEGSAKALTWPDEWTATTVGSRLFLYPRFNVKKISSDTLFLYCYLKVDGRRTAQFEHTLLITEDGVEALTGKKKTSPMQFWERDSEIHTGIWLGTTPQAKQRMKEINETLLQQQQQ